MKVIYLISEYSYYLSHRKILIDYIISKNYFSEIIVICNFDIPFQNTKNNQIKFININFKRNNIAIFNFFFVLVKIIYYIIKIRPTHIHCIAMKTIFIGMLASLFFNVKFVFSVNGLGLIYSSKKYIHKLIKKIFNLLFYLTLNKEKISLIVQNQNEFSFFKKYKTTNLFLVPGSGVNLKLFNQNKKKTFKKYLRVIFVGRLIEGKGINDFIELANKFQNDKNIKFYIFGKTDNNNQFNIKSSLLKKKFKKKIISWYGFKYNIDRFIKLADIAIFPTYIKEGIPLSLLQSIACGLSVISYNVQGCNDVIINNQNGFLVTKGDKDKLYKKTKELLNNSQLRKKFSEINKQLINKYSSETINGKVFNIYK